MEDNFLNYLDLLKEDFDADKRKARIAEDDTELKVAKAKIALLKTIKTAYIQVKDGDGVVAE